MRTMVALKRSYVTPAKQSINEPCVDGVQGEKCDLLGECSMSHNVRMKNITCL